MGQDGAMNQEWFMMENRDAKAIECSVICLERELENRDLEPSRVTCLLGKVHSYPSHTRQPSEFWGRNGRKKKNIVDLMVVFSGIC